MLAKTTPLSVLDTQHDTYSSIITHRVSWRKRKKMGSIDDDKLCQMVHDFIEFEADSSSSGHNFSPSSSKCLDHQSKNLILRDIVESETEAETKVLGCVLKHMRKRNKRGSEKTSSSNLKKWLVMKLKMDGFHASLCHTSWVTSLGCPAGDYEYIDVLVQEWGHQGPTRLIIDVDFKSQFEVARPTQNYIELIDKLPSIFVGDEEKLNKIISLLCSAAKESLRERGLHIPPWRTSTYMQSKWLSNGCHKKQQQQQKQQHPKSNNAGVFNSVAKEAKHNKLSQFSPNNFANGSRSRSGNIASGSALSSQFSDMTINCC